MEDEEGEYDIIQVYEGEETTIYYDSEGDQHVVVNEGCYVSR